MESALYGIYSLVVFVSETSIVRQQLLRKYRTRTFHEVIYISFAISDKQAHIISGNLPELRYGELGFSHKWAANPHFSSSLTQKSV